MTSAEYLPTTSMMPKRGHPSKLRSDGRKSFKRSPKAQSNISHLTLSHPDWYPGSINDSPTATNPIISGLRALTGRVHSLIDNWQERRKPVWTDRYTLDLPWQISRDASELDYLLRTNREQAALKKTTIDHGNSDCIIKKKKFLRFQNSVSTSQTGTESDYPGAIYGNFEKRAFYSVRVINTLPIKYSLGATKVRFWRLQEVKVRIRKEANWVQISRHISNDQLWNLYGLIRLKSFSKVTPDTLDIASQACVISSDKKNKSEEMQYQRLLIVDILPWMSQTPEEPFDDINSQALRGQAQQSQHCWELHFKLEEVLQHEGCTVGRPCRHHWTSRVMAQGEEQETKYVYKQIDWEQMESYSTMQAAMTAYTKDIWCDEGRVYYRKLKDLWSFRDSEFDENGPW